MILTRDSWLTLQRHEREELLATLREVGPDAPTLCSDWRASTVAAHLVVSEMGAGLPLGLTYPLRLVLGARIVAPMLRRAQRAGDRLNRRYEARGWPWLLGRLEQGPPRLYGLRFLGTIRLLEAWIHHEDVRRAAGWGPRPRTDALDAALVTAMEAVIRMPELSQPRAGLEIVLPDGTVRRLGDRSDVRVSGPPGEVLLYVAGRSAVADVSVSGDPAAVAAMEGRLAL